MRGKGASEEESGETREEHGTGEDGVGIGERRREWGSTVRCGDLRGHQEGHEVRGGMQW